MTAICSKWQPVYFIVVSLYRLIARCVVIPLHVSTGSSRAGPCDLSLEYQNQIHAAMVIWNFVILLTGVSAICSDLDADFTPALRRCAYCLVALYSLVDAVGSYIWCNVASQVQLAVGSLQFFLDVQITSSATSQAVIALHFLYVSCRSRRGRGWAYASLRFEVDNFRQNAVVRSASDGTNSEGKSQDRIWRKLNARS